MPGLDVGHDLSLPFPDLRLPTVLDPRISYEGLREDCRDDADLLADLTSSKAALMAEYLSMYASKEAQPVSTPLPISTNPDNSPRKDFTQRYNKSHVGDEPLNELLEYFRITSTIREDWNACDPLEWWRTRRAKFPHLYILARDVLCIPGSLC
jgi:hypothetical protein